MSVIKKTFAEFTAPGLFFPEIQEIEVKSRDIQKLKIPDDVYGLRFFDILITDVSNEDKKRVRAKSDPVNYSPLYNIGIKIYTKKQMTKETDEEKGLSKDVLKSRNKMLRQMTINKLNYALKCRVGGFVPLKKGELVLLVNGKERKILKVR